jgi:hypothetical protein
MRPEADEPNDEATGLPRLSAWRSVYLLVVVLFVLYVVLMVALAKGFA